MKYLCELIHSFSEEESELIVKHYLLKRNSYSKRLKLFNMIKHEGVKDDRVAAKRLYNRAPNAAFSQLKKRLREDILNLLLTFNLQSDNFCSYMEAEMRASKLILQGKILIKRGLSDAGTLLLKKAFNLAGSYEAFEVQALAYEALKSYSDNNDDIPELHDMELEFSKNVDILYDLINLRITHAESEADEFHEPEIQGIQEHLTPFPYNEQVVCHQDPHRSARLQFQYTMKLTEEFRQQKMYQRARETAEEILPILDHENQVLTPGQKGIYYGQFAEILMCLRFYREAVFYAEKSCRYLKPMHERHLASMIIQFKGYFYQHETDDAAVMLDRIGEMLEATCPKRINEYELYRAWLAFLNEDTKASIKLLNKCFKLSGSYTIVSLNGKLLELLNLLKMKDFSWFDYKLDSFRKYLQSAPEHLNLARFQLIFKLFNALKLNKYNLQTLEDGKPSEMLRLLSEADQPTSWSPLQQELIRVECWLTSYASSAS